MAAVAVKNELARCVYAIPRTSHRGRPRSQVALHGVSFEKKFMLFEYDKELSEARVRLTRRP